MDPVGVQTLTYITRLWNGKESWRDGQLKGLATLTEKNLLLWVPDTHVAVYNPLYLQCQGTQHPLLNSQTHVTHTHTYAYTSNIFLRNLSDLLTYAHVKGHLRFMLWGHFCNLPFRRAGYSQPLPQSKGFCCLYCECNSQVGTVETKRQTGVTASHSVTCQPINHYPKYKAKSVSLRAVGKDVLCCFLRTVHSWDMIQLDQPWHLSFKSHSRWCRWLWAVTWSWQSSPHSQSS